ncbi:MAG: hypothetical protein ACQESX_04390 [Bacteroidota bacterium]
MEIKNSQNKYSLMHPYKVAIPVVLLLALFFATERSFAQVQITMQKPPVKRLQLQNIWNVQINNPQNIQRRVYMIAEITDSETDELVATIRTAPLQLSSGIYRLNPQSVKITRQEFYSNSIESTLQRTHNFPGGTYQIKVTLFNADNDENMASVSIEQKVTNVYEKASEMVSGSNKKFVQFYGNGNIQAHSANRAGFGQAIPKEYLRGNLDATMEIGVAPIHFNGHITTIDNRLQQTANSFTVSFDDQRFINNLRNNLTKMIEKESGIKKENYSEAANKLKKLENIDRLLDNQTIEKELENLGDLETIEQQLNDSELTSALNQINKLKTDISNRGQEVNYEVKKEKLETQIQINKEVSFEDDNKEKARLNTIDSLEQEMKNLEQKNREIKQQNQQDLIKLDKLEEQEEKAKKLKRKKAKIEELLARKEQIDKLVKQKEELTKYKDKLEASGSLEEIEEFNLNKLRDKDILKDELLRRQMLSGGQNLLYSIEELSAGTVYPYYSPLILNGLRMTGVSFEWNPGWFYTAFSGGLSNRPHLSIERGLAEYEQRLLAGKIGVGKKNKSHIYFTALNAIDDRNSIERNDTITTPKSNFIFGTDAALRLFKGRFKLEGEIAGSKYDDDTKAEEIITNEELSNQIPGFLQPNLSSRFGLAYDIRGSIRLFKNNTVISGFLRNIDPSYNSFGAPNLRSGIYSYNAEIKQTLLAGKMAISLFSKNESSTRLWHDGLTHYERQGGKINMTINKLPRLTVSYAENNQNKGTTENSMSEFMISGSYQYRIGSLSMANTINYNQNNASSNLENGPAYSITNLLFNQMISFSFPLSLSLNLNYVDEEIRQTPRKILISDLSASVQLWKKVNISAGGNYKTEESGTTRFGGFADLSYSFAKFFTFQLKYDNNYYDEMAVNGYSFNEYILDTRLTMRW